MYKHTNSIICLLMAITCSSGCASNKSRLFKIEHLEGFPTTEKGISLGVSGCFSGMLGDKIILAGGCNFPQKSAADGGVKKFYRGIYIGKVSRNNRISWTKVGQLPEPLAYGITVKYKNSLLFIGGKNATESAKSIYRLSLIDGYCVVEKFAQLPYAVFSSAGCIIKDNLYIYGNRELCILNLGQLDAGWKFVKVNGPQRVQPCCAEIDGAFALLGGFLPRNTSSLAKICYDGLLYRQDGSWERIELPKEKQRPIAVVGACVQQISSGDFLLFGGVCRDVFLLEFNQPSKDYLTHPVEWYRFNQNIYRYSKNRWKKIGQSRSTAKAGASVFMNKNKIYQVGGELKPGVRSPEIVRISLQE